MDDSDAFVSFIAHEISLYDHHGLFRGIGEVIGLSEEMVMIKVVEGLLLFYGGEFEKIKKFIKSNMEEK